MPDPARDEFYVGYLPLPPGIGSLVHATIAGLLGILVAAAAAIGLAQRNPGGGAWHTGARTVIEGTLATLPYPMIEGDDEAILIVEQGKHGAQPRCDGLAGRRMRATGHILERDGHRMLELLPGSEGLSEAGPAAVGASSAGAGALPDQPVTLRGEILDAKCYFGAMRPGDGKGHKSCARLCLAGGIPPLFRVRDGDAAGELLLLMGPFGAAVGDDMLALVGEPVSVSGVRTRIGGWVVLVLDGGGIGRVAAGPLWPDPCGAPAAVACSAGSESSENR